MRIHGLVEPMLARAVDRLPAPHTCGGGCRYEPKLDGYLCMLVVDDDRAVGLYSRRGTPFNEAFPEIVDAAYAVVPAGTIADGELVRWTDGRLDFAALQRRSVAGRDRARELAKAERIGSLGYSNLRNAFAILPVRGSALSVWPAAGAGRCRQCGQTLSGSWGQPALRWRV